jgi:hypothetical protein
MQPENVAHGSEIKLQVQVGASFVDLAELHEVDYNADNKIEALHILGARRSGARRGRYAVNGTIKGYWLNGIVRAMFLGSASPSSAGNASALYQSQVPFTRYVISVVPTSVFAGTVNPPIVQFINVVLEKDAIHWNADKHTTEDITFQAEDILGQ